MGVAAALPGLGYIVFHVADALAHDAGARDLAPLVGMGLLGPGLVLASATRMMRRADRPVAIFVLSLVPTSLLTVLAIGLATFGPDNGGIVLGCMAALGSAVAAALTALGAAVVRARAARKS